jgi:hypothetical protein
VSYTSANRDKRHWDRADVFDFIRHDAGHIAFGIGDHACAGMGLAGLEGVAVLGAPAERVERLELTVPPVCKRIFDRRFAPNSDLPGSDRAPLGQEWPSMTSFRTRYSPQSPGAEVDYRSLSELGHSIHGDPPEFHAETLVDRIGSFNR